MIRKYLILFGSVLLITVAGCSKKHHPQTVAVKTTVVKKRVAPHPLPKTLDVSDKAASRDIDGKLYYDVEGHRYWKNYVDGKYYLFNKSMYGDPAYKPH